MVRQRIVTERMDTLRTVVQSTISMAQSLETRVATLQFTHEDAWSRLPVGIQAIRFDARFIRWGLVFAAASIRTAGLVLSKQGAAVSSDVNGFLKAVKEA